MDWQNHCWIPLTLASVLAVFLVVPTAGPAEEPTKHVMCEITTDGKTETKQVASAEECTQMGGKVATAKPYNRHHRYKRHKK